MAWWLTIIAIGIELLLMGFGVVHTVRKAQRVRVHRLQVERAHEERVATNRAHFTELTYAGTALPQVNRSAPALIRARELLLAHLSPAQSRDFQNTRRFTVFGGSTGIRYVVTRPGGLCDCELCGGGHAYPTHNILVDDPTGGLPRSVCVLLSGSRTPLDDHLLAQKLTIEAEEQALFHGNGGPTAWRDQIVALHREKSCSVCRRQRGS